MDPAGRRRGAQVAELAWPEVEERLGRGATAVLPVGAASKEHGFHLPLGTDYLQADWLGRAVAEALEVVVWPVLGYGYYPVFVEYPGSISLSRATFEAVVEEILAGIDQAGARRVAVLNTGISTIEPLRAVLARRSGGCPARLVNVYAGPRLQRVRAEVEEQAWGGHADEMETSILLALAPERVHMERASPAPVRIERGRFNRHDPQGPNYSPSGVNGDPTRATRAKGERLLAALLEDVLEALAEPGG